MCSDEKLGSRDSRRKFAKPRSSNFPRALDASDVEGDESRRAGISVFARNGARNYFRGWVLLRAERISARDVISARAEATPRRGNEIQNTSLVSTPAR